MIAALLHGRTHLNFQEFRQQNHLTFFLHVLGVLELLQPQVFQSEHQGALWDCLLSFVRLLLVGVHPWPCPCAPPGCPPTSCPASCAPARPGCSLGPGQTPLARTGVGPWPTPGNRRSPQEAPSSSQGDSGLPSLQLPSLRSVSPCHGGLEGQGPFGPSGTLHAQQPAGAGGQGGVQGPS